jgi:hypothetical protein
VRTFATRTVLSARLLAGGLKSYLPVPKQYTGTGGSISARYCYAVWLRHLVEIGRAVPELRPRVVAELGPGDSVGLGLAALLSGMDRYVAFDVLAHVDLDVNLRVLDELMALFRVRAGVPDDQEFPELYPQIEDHAFPAATLARLGLTPASDDARVQRLRVALRGAIGEGVSSHDGDSGETTEMRYICPWTTATVTPGSVDLVISQAVLQDMDHWTSSSVLRTAFEAMARWLRPGGAMSHQVNLGFPDCEHWNQHWMYGESTWRLMRGRRPYYVNRVPASEYLRLCDEYGFEVVSVRRVSDRGGFDRSRLARRFRDLPADDLMTRALHFVAVKRSSL